MYPSRTTVTDSLGHLSTQSIREKGDVEYGPVVVLFLLVPHVPSGTGLEYGCLGTSRAVLVEALEKQLQL